MTDSNPVDLTPRGAAGTAHSKWLPIAVVIAIVVAVGGLIWFLVTNSQSFLEADVAVAEREEQGDRRFQLLGSPIQDSAEVEGRTVVIDDEQFAPFTVAFDGVKVDVLSREIPPDLFNCGVPVVLEGNWVRDPAPPGIEWPVGANDGWYFQTDRILVKHDNDYTEDRILDAEERGLIEVESVAVSPDSTCQV